MDAAVLFGLRFITYLIVLVSAVIAFRAAYIRLQTWKKRKAIVDDEIASKFLGQFNIKEIDRALSGYVVPHCSPTDPANKDGEEYLADMRESIFSYMDRNLQVVQRSYHLLLADTGMGKTTFCLNYYSHCKRKFPEQNVCVVSLAGTGSSTVIKSITNKSDTILIADAFDEDIQGFGRGRERLAEILELAADFKSVIITCRSQYFLADDMIPRETPLPVLVPRKLGQSPTFSLIRSYISPFSEKEIDRYIRKHFPLLYFWRYPARKRARQLVDSVPDLAHRPMLLERLPDLAKGPAKSTELYDLYDLLVEGWLERESRWIETEALRAVSLELALIMYSQLQSRHGRMGVEEIESVAREKVGNSPNWGHLTARSLLNRDSRGLYKFAHKSILEFLVVKMACSGDDRPLQTPWTAFMKELFVSWGHAHKGKKVSERARFILQSDAGRKNVAPLCDMLGTSAVRGYPNFKRCADRRVSSSGERLAPASWRASAVQVHNENGRGIFTVVDHEYNLNWSYIPSRHAHGELLPVRVIEALNFARLKDGFRFPSYEQFICLLEALHSGGEEIIPDGALFLLEDKPGKHSYLLVQTNADPQTGKYLKLVDKQRRIANTDDYVNCYLTGVAVAPDFAANVKVDQLYIQEDLPPLL